MSCRKILIDSVGEGGLHPDDGLELHEAEIVDDAERIAGGLSISFLLVRLLDPVVLAAGDVLQYVLVQKLEEVSVIHGTPVLLLKAHLPPPQLEFTPDDWVTASKVSIRCLDYQCDGT